jgi:hypothetical protein
MSTPLVISVTDELVAELERECREAADIHGGAGSDYDSRLFDRLGDALKALLAERAELLRDAERLDWFIKECCVMECMNGSAWPVIYRIYWSHEAEGQREWHASPRAAIDAAMQSEATL